MKSNKTKQVSTSKRPDKASSRKLRLNQIKKNFASRGGKAQTYGQ